MASKICSWARSEATTTRKILDSNFEGISNSAFATLPKKFTIERQIHRQCLNANIPHAIRKDTASEIPAEYTDMVLQAQMMTSRSLCLEVGMCWIMSLWKSGLVMEHLNVLHQSCLSSTPFTVTSATSILPYTFCCQTNRGQHILRCSRL